MRSVTYAEGKFVAVSYTGYIITSTDGITWTTPVRVDTTPWYGIAYGNGKFVVVGSSRYTTTGQPSDFDNTTFHQILVQVNMPTLYTINTGTDVYFNGKTPSMPLTGIYTLVYEFDCANGVWVAGMYPKLQKT